MAFFKKVVDLFFETEEVEETKEEDTEEEVIPSPVFLKADTETLDPQPVEEKPEKKSIFITQDEPESVKKEEKPETVTKPEEKKASYEFQPIISPMFGVSAEEKQAAPVVREIKRSPVHNSSHLGTIISPIYGINGNEYIPYSASGRKAAPEEEEAIPLSDLIEEKESGLDIPFRKKEEKKEEPEEEHPVEEEILEEELYEQEELFEAEEEELDEVDYFALDSNVPLKDESLETEQETFDFLDEKEEEETSDRNAEIAKVVKEYSEEDLFERDKQPTLFDL